MSPLLEADCKTMMNLNDYPCTCEGNEEAKIDTDKQRFEEYKTDTWCQEQAGLQRTISLNGYKSDVLLFWVVHELRLFRIKWQSLFVS